jgi:AcrR family transcriptional regulator
MVYTVYMAARSTTERIKAAARKLLDRDGSGAVTMRRVAKAIGMTPMALYRHVANRDDLLNAVADAGFEELAAKAANAFLPANPEKQLMKVVDIFLDFAFENPRMFELMFLEQRKGARQFPGDFRAGKSATANFSARALQAGMKQGIFREDDVWEIAFEAGAMLQGLVMLYVGGRVDMRQDDFRAFCHRSFRRYLNGIRK